MLRCTIHVVTFQHGTLMLVERDVCFFSLKY